MSVIEERPARPDQPDHGRPDHGHGDRGRTDRGADLRNSDHQTDPGVVTGRADDPGGGAGGDGGGGPLASFARLMVRRRRVVVGAWVLALVAITVASSAFGGEHKVDYTMPGSDSAVAQRLLTERFPEASGDTVQLVFEAPDGVDAAATAAAIRTTGERVAGVEHVRSVERSAVSPDGTVSLATVQLDATVEKVPVESIEEIIEIAESADADGLTVEAGGAAVQNAEGSSGGSEQIGLIAALVILLIAFGSVLAAGLPIVVALFGVGTALAAVPLLNNVLMIPDWAPDLITMIGIGIGIDYALFIVTRYRAGLAEGLDPEEAVVNAMNTAGRAVLFAGGTVVISLLGLCSMGLEYLYGTAGAMVMGVLIVLIASMTLLPALLGFSGRSIDRFRVPFVRGDAGDRGVWARWSHVVQRRPLVTGSVALIILLLLAAPFTSLRFGYPDAGTGPEDMTSRRAYDLVSDSFGPGANSPLVLAVEPEGDPAVLDRLASGLASDSGVAAAMPATLNQAGDTAVVVVIPSTGPQDEATVDLIHRLRDDVVPVAVGRGPAQVAVGGATATSVDESEYMAERLPMFIAAVLALSFLLLLVVFRSLLVALKAAIMNVLAIGAAYGVMAMALQGGWFGQLIGINTPTPIPAWAPMMMFAILFGLSMDYEVFLLSRIREEYLRTGDNSAAVADGMAKTGRVISAAAAIMVTVFAAFILGDTVLLKVIGLGLATAVFLDATLVRMVLVPSTMALLGDRNWWLPKWLDRLLPEIDIEGDHHGAGPVVGVSATAATEPSPTGAGR